jgi:hypothetical protein
MRLFRKLFRYALTVRNPAGQTQTGRPATAASGCAHTGRRPRLLTAPASNPPPLNTSAIWPLRENGGELLDAITAAVRRHVFLPDEGAAETCALWVLHAHAHDAAQISPLLVISAPTTSCGKTTLLRVLAALTPSPLPVSDLTAAGLWRNPVARNRTVLVDEGHTLLTGNTTLQRLFNSGHTRGGAGVLRADGYFDIWCPKAIALIGELPAALRDRAIRIRLTRKRVGEDVILLDAAAVTALQELAQRVAQWSEQHFDQIAAANPVMPQTVINRAADNWRPLLAIADVAGGRWPELTRTLAGNAAAEAEVDDRSGIAALRDIRDYLRYMNADGRTDRIASEDLVIALAMTAERPWDRYNRGGPITTYQLAQLLKPFGIRSRVIRFGDEVKRGHYLHDFEEAFARYL